MEYYILQRESEPKVTGIRDGSDQAWLDDEFWERNKQLEHFMWGEQKINNEKLDFQSGIAPKFSLDLIGVPMDKDAKHSDFISVGSLMSGFVVSSRFRSLLENFHLPSHLYYKVVFFQPNKKTKEIKEVTDYWWLYFQKETGEETVDFKKSQFDTSYHQKYLNMRKEDLVISSYEEYMNIFYMTPPSLPATKLVWNANFDRELDLWGCRFLSNNDYISDRLLNSMTTAKISGHRAISAERARFTAKMTGFPYCELIFE